MVVHSLQFTLYTHPVHIELFGQSALFSVCLLVSKVPIQTI